MAPKVRSLCLFVLLAIVATIAGCSDYGYIVRTEGAPLYRDEERTEVIARMSRLDGGMIGHSEPEGDPVEIDYGGRSGYANRDDVRIFKSDSDAPEVARAAQLARREVAMEGKDWPTSLKTAIRADRVEQGMTREMVQLGWGRPSAVDVLQGGGERWTYSRLRYSFHEDVTYDWRPSASFGYYGYGHYGCGTEFGLGFAYEPTYYRTYYTRTERRTVTFGAAGTVVSWEADRF